MGFLWHKILKPILEWIGHIETIHTIAQAEFVRTLFLPTVTAVLTGTAGVLGGIPIMWVIMATALGFMGATVGILAGSLYIERRNPLNKLTAQPIFNCDLNPTKAVIATNRQQRRAVQKQGNFPELSPTQIDPNVPRTLQWGQMGVEVTNHANFPIACFIAAAETAIGDLKPPRSAFPKKRVILPPGDKIRLCDDRMAMEDMPCQRLAGTMKLLIKYGLPDKEVFEMRVEGAYMIVMERFGAVSQIQFSPEAATTTTTTTNN